MAERESRGGSGTVLAFIVGGLVVAVAGLGYFYFEGGSGSGIPEEVNIQVETPGGGEQPASE